VQPAGNTATKGGMRPLHRMLDQTVLHRIEMNVVQARREIALAKAGVVADRVLPVSSPQMPRSLRGPERSSRFTDAYGFRQPFLDRAPKTREVGIAFRQ